MTTLKQVNPETKALFDNAYDKLKFPLAEHSLSWILLWDFCYRDMEWAEINGNLCLFITFDGKRCVWGPPLPGNMLHETASECFSLCEEYGKRHGLSEEPEILYIPEELKEAYEKIEWCTVSEQGHDYIYTTEDIITLKGNKYKDKRNKRNHFISNHNYSVEDYEMEKHEQGCAQLIESWRSQKEQWASPEDKEKIRYDTAANTKIFQSARELDIPGMVVKVNGRIEGYIFGQKTRPELCTLFLGKTNLKVKGLSQFIFGEFLKRRFPEAKYVNDGEDWDVGYLQHAKESYHPAMVRKSYKLSKKVNK